MRHTKCFAATLILSLILLPQLLFAGSDYFWAGDKKVSIVSDRSTLVVVFKEESYQKNISSIYAKVPDLVEATISGDQPMVVLVFQTDRLSSEPSVLQSNGLSPSDIEWHSFGYFVLGSSPLRPLRPTNRISFKLKGGSLPQQLERFMQGKATFDHTHFGTPTGRITFTSTSGSWQGITLTGANNSSLQYCDLNYPISPIVATNTSNLTINNVSIGNSSFQNYPHDAAMAFYNSSPTISSVVINGQSNSWNGVRFAQGSTGSITNSTIQNSGAAWADCGFIC
ncbi:MAG: hypothetical protein C4326_10085 [Ignavibacteria bacterium]